MQCITDDRLNGNLYRLGSGKSMSMDEVWTAVKTVAGFDLMPRFLPRKSEDTPTVGLADISAAVAVGWRPKTAFIDGVRAQYEYLSNEFAARERLGRNEMIITRTPFRITLGGGGTDLPSYYEKYGGFIFSAGLDKYMYIDLNRSVADDLIRVKYSKSETVEHVDELQHDIAREILHRTGIEKNIEISSLADIPAGTGLGSSSCYAVGLLHAIHTMKRDYVPLAQLAELDFQIEANILKRPIGKQDPYMGAFGGLTVLEIARDGTVKVRKANVSYEVADELNKNTLIFFTGTTRSADEILREQEKGAQEGKSSVVESMHFIREIGYQILEAVESGNIDG